MSTLTWKVHGPVGAHRPQRSVGAGILDRLAAALGTTLRHFGVRISPAEVIEIRRTLALIGGSDVSALRAALRSVCVKYAYEAEGFTRAFDLFFAVDFFGADPESASDEALPRPRGVAAELPDDVVWDEDFAGSSRMIGADEHTEEIGHLMVDDPDAAARTGESAHREENDFSVSAGAEELGVDQNASAVSGGVTYTIEVDDADSATVGELVGAAARVSGQPLGYADAAAILRALDAHDGRRAYGADGLEGVDAQMQEALERALVDFIDALTERLADISADDAAGDGPGDGETRDGEAAATGQADIDRACHQLIARIRGAPRSVVRRTDRGGLDVRRTMRAASATDGVPIQLWRRDRVPGPPRLLVVVDVSLSVRPVAGFFLRLAQTLHRFGDRCEVVAFVDEPVRVTTALTAANADDALAAVLASDCLDLSATSDYGTLWRGLRDGAADLLTGRTSMLVVGDGRSNGFDPEVGVFADIARRIHRVAWVSPEPRRYWTQTGCAVADYAEHCAGAVSARDGAEMSERVPELGAALR